MAKYIWSPPVYQLGVTGNAAAANSVVTMYSNAANIITNQIPYFFTRNSGLGGNITGLLANASFTFDGANFIVANTTANTNVIITTNGDYFGTGNLSIAGNITGNGAGITGVSAGGLSNGTSSVTIPVSSGNIIAAVAAGNVVTIAADGQYTTGNISATGDITANANVNATYFLGNGALLTGVTTSSNAIFNGTSNVAVTAPNGNVTVGVGGTDNIVVVGGGGLFVTGEINVTGGNVIAPYFAGDGSLLTNLPAGNSTAIVNGTSNVEIPTLSGNVVTSVAGNPGILTVAASGVYVAGDISASGNIIGNLNEVITSNISATGNITSNNYFIGNGALLTGILTTVSNIVNGLSNVSIDTFSGNVTFGIAGTPNVAIVNNFGIVSSNNMQAIGNLIAGNVLTAGNVSGNYILGNGSFLTGLTAATGNITFTDTTLTPNYTLGNITLQTNDTANSLTYDMVFDATGNLTVPGNATANFIYANSGLFLNANTITANYVIPDGYNALSAGPIVIQSGSNVSGNGNWVVV